MARPGMKLFALAIILKKRNAEPARVCNPREFDQNNRAHVLTVRKGFCERGKFRFMRLDHTPVAVQPENVRWSLERAEHEYDSSILFQVSDGLHAASVEIDVGHRGRPQDAERVQTFRGKVYVPAGIQRR